MIVVESCYVNEECEILENNIRVVLELDRTQISEKLLEVLINTKYILQESTTCQRLKDTIIVTLPLLYIQIKKISSGNLSKGDLELNSHTELKTA